jgi:FKBP-type peptidyl-prolyl cis-trans isomerase FkpA
MLKINNDLNMKQLLLAGLILSIFVVISCKKDKDDIPDDYVLIDIHKYAKEHFPDAQPDENGMYIIVNHVGSGEKPDSAEWLSVYYVGKLMDSVPDRATVFDATHRRPHDTILPASKRIFGFEYQKPGSVIQGWHLGFGQLNKGSRAILLIPDSLAYGELRRGLITPYSPLMFEVELLNLR